MSQIQSTGSGGGGGTGNVSGPGSSTVGDIVTWNNTTGTLVADSGVAFPIPVASGGTALTSTTANQILYSSSNSVIAGLPTANNGTLITSAGGVPSISSTLPAAVQGNITTVGTVTTGVWNGTAVDATHGGTGQTSYTTGDTLYASATNTLSKLPIATRPGQFMNYNGTNVNWYNSLGELYDYDDFTAASDPGKLGWLILTASGGRTWQLNGVPNNQNPGILALTTNASTSASPSCSLVYADTDAGFFVGNGRMIFNFIVGFSALSNGTDTYTAYIGLRDRSAAFVQNDIKFQYTSGVNSGNWQIVTSNAGTTTTANTSTAAVTGFTRFTIDINAAGTSVAFFINGTAVANSPIATNIPTAGIAPLMQIVKSAGTTNTLMYIDYADWYWKMTTART